MQGPENISVSVVIPMFNAENSIKRTLDSIAQQSVPPHEIVLVDDGSTDNSQSIVTSWQDSQVDISLKYVKQDNGGVASARNTGITSATGTLIATVDSDDELLPHHISGLRQAFELSPDLTLVFADQNMLFSGAAAQLSFLKDKTFKSVSFKPVSGDYYLVEGSLWSSLIGGNIIPTSASMFRRDAALEVGLYDTELRTSEDRDFMLRLTRERAVGFLDQVLCLKHHDGMNLTDVSNQLAVNRNSFFTVRKQLDMARQLNLSQEELKTTLSELKRAAYIWSYQASGKGLIEFRRFVIEARRDTQYPVPLNLRHLGRSILHSICHLLYGKGKRV